MNLFKKLVALNYRKDVLPLQVLKEPQKILVLLPIEPYEEQSFIQPVELLRKSFMSAEITGVMRAQNGSFFHKSNLFDKIITYESKPFFLSRQFFRLRKQLRAIKAPMSIDFNTKSDSLTWLGGATLRIGYLSSSFINYKVKLPPGEPIQNAMKLVQAICMSRR